MIAAEAFLDEAKEVGVGVYSGVPCSILKPLINCMLERDDITYVGAASEGGAVGIASGAYLTGRMAAVVCQNSGLGNAVNPLTSLNAVFRIPVLLVVTLRGEPGQNDAPEHELMGQITADLLEVLRIPYEWFPHAESDLPPALERAVRTMAQSGLPYAFVLRKGTIEDRDCGSQSPRGGRAGTVMPREMPSPRSMSRWEAIELLAAAWDQREPIVSTTGKISRELFCLNDSARNLYMVGSMGCAAAIGLGICLSRPDLRVLVLDGDGAALMKLGTLATVGHYRPRGFVHVILDNESYESTGGQATSSPCVEFDRVAAACGYASAVTVCSRARLASEIERARGAQGPQLIHVKVKGGSMPNLPRPDLTPIELKSRFMAAVEADPGA